MKKPKFRSKKLFIRAELRCPIHGMSRVYEIFDEEGKDAIGCCECFKKLPIKIKRNENP
jgi:hypothetical protein